MARNGGAELAKISTENEVNKKKNITIGPNDTFKMCFLGCSHGGG